MSEAVGLGTGSGRAWGASEQLRNMPGTSLEEVGTGLEEARNFVLKKWFLALL